MRPRSTAEVSDLLRSTTTAVLVAGAGTKATWGGEPEAVDVVVDTTGLSGVVEHVAGDLVVTARAGTPLEDLDAALAPAGQRLSADPVVSPEARAKGTIGGLVATAATGPLRLSAGAVRDLLIGVEMVRADGVVAKAGGKVVKNVAGYDLCKLLTGSWGTLAVITAATFRLHPRPAATTWVTLPSESLGALRGSPLTPAAAELDWSGGEGTVVAAFEGTEEGAVARAREACASLGAAPADGPPPWWALPPWPTGGTGLRCTFALSGLTALLDAVAATGLPWAVRGSAAVGVVHVGVGSDADPPAVRSAVSELRQRAGEWAGQVVVLDGPPDVRAGIDVWGPAGGLDLMRRVKATFDPQRRLAPGRFVGGI